MSFYIICVASNKLDVNGFEGDHISDSYVPVKAESEEDACKKAVFWHADSDVVVEDDDLHWKCDDKSRGLSFKAKKCLGITKDELNIFLSLTQGVSVALVIGDDTGKCGKCKSNLTAHDSVQREYINKDGGPSLFATGHYVDEYYVNDTFGGFDDKRYSQQDDSDTCITCTNPL